MNALTLRAVEAEVVGPGFFLEENPFKIGSLRYIEVPEGAATLDDYAAHAATLLPPGMAPYLQAWIGEHRVAPDKWALVRPKPSANVTIRVRPHGKGGKNILRVVLIIAVVALATVFLGPGGGFVAGTLGLTGTAAAVASAVLIATATMIGTMAINALIPPPGLTNSNGKRDPRFQLTGTNNRFAPYASIPWLAGKMRVYPLVAARPYTENVGKHQYLRMLLMVGWGPIKVSDIRIGNTPIEAFRNVEYEVHEGGPPGWAGNRTITLYNRSVTETPLNIELFTNSPAPLQTTDFNTVEIGVDIVFPYGLIEFESDGDQDTATTRHRVEYRAVGSGTWLPAPLIDDSDIVVESGGVIKITEKTPEMVRHTARFQVPSGRYEVRITRLDIVKQTASTDDDTWLDKSFWACLRSYSTDQPVTQTGVTLIAIRMQASEQLNGIPDTISCTAEAYKPVYNGSVWSYQLTQSPAWAFADILRGRANLPDARVDLATLMTWATDCAVTAPNAAEERWTYNGVIEGGSIYEALRQVASIGRAAYTLKDGKHSVVMDKAQATPVQHITPANSWGYTGTRTYLDLPHGLKIEFQNKAFDYEVDERIVYADGYSEANATKFEVLQLFGCTSDTLVFREGRYHLAVATLRPEEHRVNMDIEALRCTLGDRVQLTHDVISVGKGFGRIVSTTPSGGNTIGFVLDGEMLFEVGATYQLRVRQQDGTTSIRTVTAAPGWQTTVSCAAEPTSGGPKAGDLFMFGLTGLESLPAVVKRIEPGPDLSAVLTLVPYDAAIYTADTGTIPAFNSYMSGDFSRTPPGAPGVVLRSDVTAVLVTRTGTTVRLAVDITAPASSPIPIAGYEVRQRLNGSTSWHQVGNLHQGTNITVFITPVSVGQVYEVSVRAKGVNGLFSAWVQPADHTIIGNSQAPSAPTNISLVMLTTGNSIQWTNPIASDLRGVQLWANKSNSFSGSLKVGETLSGQIIHAPVYPGDVYNYWLVSVNTSGQGSVPLYIGSLIRPQASSTGSGDSYIPPPPHSSAPIFGGGGGDFDGINESWIMEGIQNNIP